jgi:peptide deformylase
VAVRDVLRVPHPALKTRCRPLGAAELGELEALADDLVDTMRAHPRCVGIAAPQIGVLTRVLVVDVAGHPRAPAATNGLIVLANPTLISASGTEVGREGCLSVPEFTANVRRATDVVVEGLAKDGAERSVEASGFEARCLLHELDHLDGVLFLDRVDSLSRDVFRRRDFGAAGGSETRN